MSCSCELADFVEAFLDIVLSIRTAKSRDTKGLIPECSLKHSFGIHPNSNTSFVAIPRYAVVQLSGLLFGRISGVAQMKNSGIQPLYISLCSKMFPLQRCSVPHNPDPSPFDH